MRWEGGGNWPKTMKVVAFKSLRFATISVVQPLWQRENTHKLYFEIKLSSFLIFFFVKPVQSYRLQVLYKRGVFES